MSSSDRQVKRFTGADLTLVWTAINKNNEVIGQPTIVSTEYTKFNYEASIRTEEKTAGNERDASFNATIREGKWDLTVYDIARIGVVEGINVIMTEGALGNLYAYPVGQVTGEPLFAFPAMVTGVKHPFEYDKNKMVEITGLKNGAYIKPLNSLL